MKSLPDQMRERRALPFGMESSSSSSSERSEEGRFDDDGGGAAMMMMMGEFGGGGVANGLVNLSAALERVIGRFPSSKVSSFNYFGDFATLLTTCIVVSLQLYQKKNCVEI